MGAERGRDNRYTRDAREGRYVLHANNAGLKDQLGAIGKCLTWQASRARSRMLLRSLVRALSASIVLESLGIMVTAWFRSRVRGQVLSLTREDMLSPIIM